MTVEISYFQHLTSSPAPLARTPYSSESVTISASPGLSGATPDGMSAIRLTGTEAFRFEYSKNGATSATATSHYVAAGQEVWIAPGPTASKFSLRTP